MIALIVALVALALLVTFTAGWWPPDDQPSPERPGTDEQWAELADAMRRYRRHKVRSRRV